MLRYVACGSLVVAYCAPPARSGFSSSLPSLPHPPAPLLTRTFHLLRYSMAVLLVVLRHLSPVLRHLSPAVLRSLSPAPAQTLSRATLRPVQCLAVLGPSHLSTAGPYILLAKAFSSTFHRCFPKTLSLPPCPSLLVALLSRFTHSTYSRTASPSNPRSSYPSSLPKALLPVPFSPRSCYPPFPRSCYPLSPRSCYPASPKVLLLSLPKVLLPSLPKTLLPSLPKAISLSLTKPLTFPSHDLPPVFLPQGSPILFTQVSHTSSPWISLPLSLPKALSASLPKSRLLALLKTLFTSHSPSSATPPPSTPCKLP